MHVRIVDFPETKIAVLEHHGQPALEYQSIQKLIEWRIQNKLPPEKYRSYGLHYNDLRKIQPEEYHVDLCVSIDSEIPPNPQGVINKVIPASRCAVARHLGSRENMDTAVYLYEVWFPSSGETLRDFPMFFHYVNVGAQIQERDMITDVYLPVI